VNILLSIVIGFFSILIWIFLYPMTTWDYSVNIMAAVIPAFLIGLFSDRKAGYLVIAPIVSCLCILVPPWLQMHNSKWGDGAELFFYMLVLSPGYSLLYVGASSLAYLISRSIRKKRERV
jgi:MFS family permease